MRYASAAPAGVLRGDWNGGDGRRGGLCLGARVAYALFAYTDLAVFVLVLVLVVFVFVVVGFMVFR